MPRLLSYAINLQRKVFFVPLNQRLYIFSLTHSSKLVISSKVGSSIQGCSSSIISLILGISVNKICSFRNKSTVISFDKLSALNLSNDITVDLFLNEQILFTDIPRINEIILEEHPWIEDPTLEDITNLEEWVKEKIYNL